jgi:hypothetical protein
MLNLYFRAIQQPRRAGAGAAPFRSGGMAERAARMRQQRALYPRQIHPPHPRAGEILRRRARRKALPSLPQRPSHAWPPSRSAVLLGRRRSRRFDAAGRVARRHQIARGGVAALDQRAELELANLPLLGRRWTTGRNEAIHLPLDRLTLAFPILKCAHHTFPARSDPGGDASKDIHPLVEPIPMFDKESATGI